MNALRSLYQITKADLLDRTRRASFLIIIGITIYISILFIPPIEANFLTVSLDQYRGIYNSAWIGTAFGLVASTTLPMFLFYIVKNAISRDTNTGVGKIIAASPIRTSTYILGKWLSNLAVLLLILVVMTIMAGVMQLVRAEDLILKPVTLITPLWLMGVPVFGLVAAAAVLFESINGLKGGLGNVIYFFVLIFATSFTLLTTVGFDDQSPMIEHPANDYMGISYPIASMQSSVLEIAPDYSGSFSIGNSTSSTETLLFNWPGFNWPKETILSRGFWLFAAMMIALAAAIPFRRFDPAHEKIASINSPGFARKHFQKISQPISWGSKLVVKAFTRATKPLIGLISRSRFGTVVLAELRLALRGQSRWWYVITGIFILLGVFNTTISALENILPFAWIWPILIWSQLGAREGENYTEKFVFSTPRPILGQMPASWVAGFLVSLFAASGVAVNLLFSSEWGHLSALVIGAGFIPALALTLGSWSGSSRLFEIIYLIWWYLINNGSTALDFMGTSEASLNAGRPLFFLIFGLALLGMSAIGRWQKLQS